MRAQRLFDVATSSVVLAVAPSACGDSATSSIGDIPSFKKGGGGGAGLVVSLSGDLSGAEQTVGGRNDAQTLSVNGHYTLALALDLATLECGDLPGRIPNEPGLVAFVQNSTPVVGALDIAYDKTAPDPGRVDSWTTTIGGLDNKVQFFRWASSDLTEGADGTVVQVAAARSRCSRRRAAST